MGFVSKLFAEAIEEMSMKQVEAVRATGASFMSVLAMGVLPQVMARFVGFSTYQLDSNLRASAVVGIVGAGGIGSTLANAFGRYDYDFALVRYGAEQLCNALRWNLPGLPELIRLLSTPFHAPRAA